jgi:hypothetical protein
MKTNRNRTIARLENIRNLKETARPESAFYSFTRSSEMPVMQRTWVSNMDLTRRIREKTLRDDLVVESMFWQGSTHRIVGVEISKEMQGVPLRKAFIVVLIENPTGDCCLSSPPLLEEVAQNIPLDELPE